MSKNTEFIKIGDRLIIKPKGADYDLIPGKVYDLSYDRYSGDDIFKENGELALPKKIYTSKKDDFFRKRILNYFNNSFTDTTGVLMAGTKGTGKTLQAKVIARDSNLPIVIVDPGYPENRLIKFFKQINTPICILFDEVDKAFQTEKMLDFLDGLQKTSKKLVIMTCNNLGKVSEFLQDRCSRIRYLRKYAAEDNLEFLEPIITDMGIKNAELVANYCRENIELLSMDNIVAFLNEVKLLEDEECTLDEIISVMNIATKNTPKTTSVEPLTISSEPTIEIDDIDFDDFDDYDEQCCCAA